MKPRLLPLAAAALGALAVPALAGDAENVLHKARKAQLAAPACRITINSKQVETGRTTVVVIETVRPRQIHMRQEQDGKMTVEVFADGTKTLLRQEANSAFVEAPADVGKTVGELQTSGIFEAMAGEPQDVKVAGHEMINGQAATIYTFTADDTNTQVHSKLWISDQDALPQKGETDSTSGEFQDFPGSDAEGVHRHSEITFSYDPSITVTMPPAT